MKSGLFVVVALCLGTCKLAEAKALADEKSQLKDGIHVERRYAESTIASDISKIMDSMVQKNFVNFLLNQREKKSEPLMDPEDEEVRDFNDFLKKELSSWVHSKGIRTGDLLSESHIKKTQKKDPLMEKMLTL